MRKLTETAAHYMHEIAEALMIGGSLAILVLGIHVIASWGAQ